MNDEQRYLAVTHTVGEYLLAALDRACGQTGTDYALFAGTLLGAVRNAGWIPWDDDIDVLMFREDYDAFRAVAQAHLPDDVEISDLEINPDQVTAIPRLLHLPTVRFEFSRPRKTPAPETVHLALDIFILDRAPDSPLRRWLWRKQIRLLEKLVIAERTSAADVLDNHESGLPAKAVELAGVALSKTASAGTWRRRYIRTCKRYQHRADLAGRYSATNSLGAHRLILFDRDEILPPETVRFEDIDARGPQDPQKMLTAMYGPDYLTPPPADQRKPVHLRNGLTTHVGGELIEVRPSA